jgi:hypothetical protein
MAVKGVRSGVCTFCGCDYYHPCPTGCGWATRGQTLCTECVPVREAWTVFRLPVGRGRREPKKQWQFARAFFIGFAAGSEDERSTGTKNPYATSTPRREYWRQGYAHGRAYLADAA